MPIKKESSYIGLAENANIRYDVVDRSLTSEDYFQITEFPETLTSGKNVFKFRGSPDTLVNDSRIHVEILDYNGDPIYFEVLNYIEKDGVRVLAVYIYPDTPEGRCTFYLGGRASYNPETDERFRYSVDQNADDWKDLPNILWTRESRVAPNRRNDSEIILLQEPKVTIKEEVKTFSEITDLPTFFKVVNGDGSSIAISGTGPGAGYTTLTTTISTTTNRPGMTDPAGMPVSPIVEGGFSARSPAMGHTAISIAMPSSFANSPAVQGNANAVTTNPGGLSTSAVNTATANVGNNGPGGTTTTRLAPPMPTFTSPSSATPNADPADEETTVTSIQQLVFNPPDTTTVTMTGFNLTGSHHLGATIVINNPKITAPDDAHLNSVGEVIHATSTKASTGGGSREVDCTYVGTIVDIENSTTAKLHPPFDFTIGRDSKGTDGEHVIDFNNSAFTMSYWVPQMSSETENSMSFANVVINNIEPATGDIYSIKTLYKAMGAPGEFIDAGNTILEMSDLMIDKSSNSPDLILGVKDTNMGAFIDSGRYSLYWQTIPTDTSAATEANWDNDYFGESTKITGPISNNTHYIISKLKNEYSPTLYANTEYQLSFFAKAKQNDSMDPASTSVEPARIDVYLSGSAGETSTIGSVRDYYGYLLGAPKEGSNGIIPKTNPNAQTTPLGIYVGSVELNVGTEGVYNAVQFVPEDTDKFTPYFVIRKGEWYIKNVQLTANIETGFSPNTAEMNIRIPTDKMNAPMAFKFQYLDYVGKPAEVETFAQGAIFDGDNVYIEGDSNLLSGSVFVGSHVGSGIELAGVRSGFIRSIGYEGFTSASRTDKPGGFMFFSGSVLPDGADSYDGVGLELVQHSESFFRYRTNPAELTIRTDSFFLGGASNYISGSGGDIEISSSNFLLSSSGDVVMQGTITAAAGGTIGGWQIGATALSSSNNNIMLDSDGPYHISASGFQVNTEGAMSASAGNIAGWKINDYIINSLDDTGGLKLDSYNKEITVRTGSNLDTTILSFGRIGGTVADPKFGIEGLDENGNLLFKLGEEGNEIANWQISGSRLSRLNGAGKGIILDADGSTQKIEVREDDNNRIQMYHTTANNWGIKGISGSNTIFALGDPSGNGNKIAGWEFNESYISKPISGSAAYQDHTRVFMSSVNDNAHNITEGFTLYRKDEDTEDGGVKVVRIGGLSDITNLHANDEYGIQVIKQNGADDYANLMYIGPTTQSISGWNFDEYRLYSFTSSIQDKYGISLDANYQLITIHGNAGDGKNNVGRNDRDNVMLAIGQTNATNEWGIKGWNVPGNRIFELSTERQEIAGWTFDDEKLVGGNMIIKKEGTIVSDGFASNVAGSGFILTAASGGMLEVENARIRGTLATAVFEKETVNAVGGQLYIANSTTLTESIVTSGDNAAGFHKPGGYHGAADTTMSVANVTGFADGEILSFKKISNTGFQTEYVYINSASRFDEGSETNYGGYIYVNRGYSGSLPGSSGSLGDLASSAQPYSGSQVTVSTGRVGTGYVRINANPNDPTTPYIDIVERTGSAIYDIDLKARLGDLSGVEDTINGQSVSGYGLYTDNAFLKGGIVATYGAIGGFAINNTTISSSNNNLILKDSGQITGSTVLFSGGEIAGWDISSTTLANSTNIILDADGKKISINDATFGNTGIQAEYNSGTPRFFAGKSSAGYLKFDGTDIEISSSNFRIDSNGNVQMSGSISSSAGRIGGVTIGKDSFNNDALFIGTGTWGNSNTGFFLNSYGTFSLKDKLTWDGTTLNVTGDITVAGGPITASLTDFPSDANLFAYYPLHNSVISSAGYDRVLDYSGNDYHGEDDAGSISGGTVFVSGSTSGPVPGAASFDGSNSRIDVNAAKAALTANMDLSLSFWIKKTNSTQDIYPFGFHDGANNDLIWQMDSGGAQITKLLVDGVDLGTLTVPTTYEFTNEWRHIVIVIQDGSKAELFVDGDYIGFYPTANADTANIDDVDEILFGGELDAGGGAPTNDFTGYMSEFRMYNTALSAGNINALYNQPTGPPSQGTKISGDMISSGQIKSNNWGSSAGSNLALNDGTATFGGSSGQRIEIDGANANLKFYEPGGANVITIDDNVDMYNPGIQINNGVMMMTSSVAVGNTNEALFYVKASNIGSVTSDKLGAFIGISDGTLDDSYSGFGICIGGCDI